MPGPKPALRRRGRRAAADGETARDLDEFCRDLARRLDALAARRRPPMRGEQGSRARRADPPGRHQYEDR
jgi:hypothetical protein